jgi:hypothetical protein
MMNLKMGINRPMTAGIQQALKVTIDGFFGEETNGAVRNFQNNTSLIVDGIVGRKTFNLLSPSINPVYKIMEIIASMECDDIDDCWKFAKDNDDGYGTNYGAINMNIKGGSVGDFMRWYAPKGVDFEDFVGTPEGAVAQIEMFLHTHFARASEFMAKVGSTDPAFAGVLCDGQVQGGCIFPSRHPREENWWLWPQGENWELFKRYLKEQYSNEYLSTEQAFTNCILHAADYGITHAQAFAAIHPMSGNAKDYMDQTLRRNLWVYGEGTVHLTHMNIMEYGL